MLKKKELLAFAKDRLAISLLVGLVLLLFILIIMTIVTVRPSEVQVPARYSGYGVTNIYRDAWWGLASFIPFAFLVGGVNSYIAIKAHALRRGLAIGLLGMSVFIALVSLVVAGAVFRLASAVL